MRTPDPDDVVRGRTRDITTAGDIINVGRTHQRTGSNSSVSSDTVFEDSVYSGINKSRAGSRKERPRDLEAILGREDHLLVKRIFEEHKDTLDALQAKLTQQEEVLIQKISEASLLGRTLGCFDVWNIIQSH